MPFYSEDQSGAAHVPTMADLPPNVLVGVFSHLEAPDRHQVALVNKRWHEAARAPELCREVVCNKPHKLQSLHTWLQRYGQHVRRFRIGIVTGSEEAEELAACCVSVCAALGRRQLESLTFRLDHIGIDPHKSLLVGAWAAGLAHLQRLALHLPRGSLHVNTSLHQLSAVRKMSLGAESVQLAPDVQLPPGLEELSLKDRQSASLPDQLAGLSALHTLVLTGGWGRSGYDVLERLPRLRRLHCIELDRLPACLPRLHGLAELVVRFGRSDIDEVTQGILGDALQEINLTSLALFDMPMYLGLPPSITDQRRLERACFTSRAGLLAGTALPAGPWAASLRQLGAPCDVLAASSEVLAAAGKLEEVAVVEGMLDNSAADSTAGARFLRWCAEHPPLRRLHVMLGSDAPEHAGAALQALQDSRPSLSVQANTWRSSFLDQFEHRL